MINLNLTGSAIDTPDDLVEIVHSGLVRKLGRTGNLGLTA